MLVYQRVSTVASRLQNQTRFGQGSSRGGCQMNVQVCALMNFLYALDSQSSQQDVICNVPKITCVYIEYVLDIKVYSICIFFSFVYLYICILVCFYICIFVCFYICIIVYLYVCKCLYFCVYIYMYLYVSMFVFLYICMFVHVYICIYIYIYTYISICLYVCIFVYLCICISVYENASM